MLSIRKIFFYLFLYALLIQLPCIVMVKFLDELGVALLVCLMAVDVIVNGNYWKYRHFGMLLCVMLGYLIYSLTLVHNNTPEAVLTDFVIQMKPFASFFIAYAIAPEFDKREKKVLKMICVLISTALLLMFLTKTVSLLIMHPMYLGTSSLFCFLVYLYCSIKDDGTIEKRDLLISFAILAVGLTSTKSKLYGEFVMALYFFFLYKPGVLKKIKLKQVALLIMVGIAVLAVSWKKLNFYFLSEVGKTFDEESLVSMARPAMYVGMGMLLMMYPILGSGLASFSTYASSAAINYSQAYYDTGLSGVYGMSPEFGDFIADTFYPELAQFGFVGIALFVMFWMWIYRKLRVVLHKEGKYMFSLGFLVILSFIIESIAGAVFIQGPGVLEMMLLGMIVGKYKDIKKDERQAIYASGYADSQTEKMETNNTIYGTE